MRIYLYRYYVLTNYIKVMVYDAVNNGGTITDEIINEVIWVPYASRIVTSPNGNTSDEVASFGILVTNMSILSVLKYNLSEGVNTPNIFYKEGAVTTFEVMLDDMIMLTGYSDNVKTSTTSIWGSITGYIENQTDLQNILDTKQDDLLSGVNIKTVKGQNILGSGNIDITKSDVGLSNVDNTSDVDKPVSTAQTTAIGLKENSANKATTMTGNETSNTLFLTAKAIYDWAVALFQAKLVSGTNIKTINETSVLGSGNITISGGGASGIHTILKGGGSLFGGVETSNMVSSANLSSYTCQPNQIIYFPYVPNNDFTSTSLSFNVTSATAGAKCKLYIYSHNGTNVPSSQLYESAEIDLSTTGNKTINVAYNFTKGTVYWFGIYSNIFGPNISAMNNNGGCLPVAWIGTTLILSWGQVSLTYPTAPTTASPNTFTTSAPLIRLK